MIEYWLPKDVFSHTLMGDGSTISLVLLPSALKTATLSRQLSYCLGRECAAQALLKAGSTATVLERHTNGLPIWPDGWVGSISHHIQLNNDKYIGTALVIVARQSHYQAIAIDFEPIFTPQQALEMSQLLASTTELRLGQRLGIDASTWLTQIYSVKECLFKLLFTTVEQFMPFNAAEVLSFDVQNQQAGLILTVNWGDLAAGTRFWLHCRATASAVVSMGLWSHDG